jgi:hypothetical protein
VVPGPGTWPRGLRHSVHSVAGGLPGVPRGLRMGPPRSRGASCPWVPTAGADGQDRHCRRDAHITRLCRRDAHITRLSSSAASPPGCSRVRAWSVHWPGACPWLAAPVPEAPSDRRPRTRSRSRRRTVQLWRTPRGPSQSAGQCPGPLCAPRIFPSGPGDPRSTHHPLANPVIGSVWHKRAAAPWWRGRGDTALVQPHGPMPGE